MLPNSDLDAALAFVVGCIIREAVRCSAPLDDDEKDFLHHLPTQPTNPMAVAASGFNTAYEELSPTLVLRDLRFERLCSLARSAQTHDLQTHPETMHEWEFAAAVLRLHRHPMSWLLGWAGIQPAKRPARRDLLLLVATAAFVVLLSLVGALTLFALTEGQNRFWNWTLWVAGGLLYCVLMAALYFAVRRFEARQQQRDIERYRRNLPGHGSLHNHI